MPPRMSNPALIKNQRIVFHTTEKLWLFARADAKKQDLTLSAYFHMLIKQRAGQTKMTTSIYSSQRCIAEDCKKFPLLGELECEEHSEGGA